jgi:hypothetical protein
MVAMLSDATGDPVSPASSADPRLAPVFGPIASRAPIETPVPSHWKYVPSAWRIISWGAAVVLSTTVSSHAPTTGLEAVGIGLASCARVAEANQIAASAAATAAHVQ